MNVTFYYIRLALAALLLACLASCTPEMNWRELPAADGALRVAFPARPTEAVRELPAGQHALTFHLTAAKAGEGVFAVGHARLPPGLDEARRAALREALETSLARNLQAGEVQRRSVSLRPLPGSTRPAMTVDELEIRGIAGDAPAWVMARVFVLDEQIVEVAVIGPEDARLREAARSFLDSLRLR